MTFYGRLGENIELIQKFMCLDTLSLDVYLFTLERTRHTLNEQEVQEPKTKQENNNFTLILFYLGNIKMDLVINAKML